MSRLLAVFAGLLLGTFAPNARAGSGLVLEQAGLKNTYRVVFEEFDEQNHFVTGTFEVLGDDDGREKPHTRIPFAADIKGDPKKNETLAIRCTASQFFFPPADKKEPYPPLTWTLTGRKGGKPVLKAKFWIYDGGKEVWSLEEIEFEKAGR